jgi:acyl transferase domain-containing protein
MTGSPRSMHRMDGRVIFLVPGQGNDPRGALIPIYRTSGAPRSVMERALKEVDRVAAEHRFGSVRGVLLSESRPPLAPGMAQLAGYAASVVLGRSLAATGIEPRAIVGQSFGEIAALVCAEVFDVTEGARAVCGLNAAFRDHEGRGAMVMVDTSEQETRKLLARVGRPDLLVACVNAPEETIVSGPNAAVAALLALDDPYLPRLRRLPVPYASHHPALSTVADRFRDSLSDMIQRPLRHPVLSPVRRRPYTDADDLRAALADCVVKPVHLTETLERLIDPEKLLFVEIGIGDSLCRCVRATLPGARTIAPLIYDAFQFPAQQTSQP